MWRAWASPGADVAGASSVPVQMWLGRVQSVFKCGLMTAGSVPRSPGVRQVEFSIATSTAKKSLKRATRITLIERAVVKREQVRPDGALRVHSAAAIPLHRSARIHTRADGQQRSGSKPLCPKALSGGCLDPCRCNDSMLHAAVRHGSPLL